MTPTRATVLLVASLVAVAGCGSSSGDGLPPGATACYYDFTATVRQGPDAPLALEGQLSLGRLQDGRMAGYLAPSASLDDETTWISVRGQATPPTVLLTFSLPDGRLISGTGKVDTTPGVCAPSIAGTLTGPGAGDSGDWDGTTQPAPTSTIIEDTKKLINDIASLFS